MSHWPGGGPLHEVRRARCRGLRNAALVESWREVGGAHRSWLGLPRTGFCEPPGGQLLPWAWLPTVSWNWVQPCVRAQCLFATRF